MAPPTGRIFESENETLAPASYYVTNTKKWGVSNVGLFNDRKAPSYFQNTLSQIAGTGSTNMLSGFALEDVLHYYRI
uniref:Uncharacterized protein n=1 Tax=Nelumbo nucifera TaxID=4432 RepID=A0A822ZHU6_NELNU|nr:TPA_asm: hypothetical protein HUJ06_002423 [Nelumbo nucifera]